MKVDWSKVKYFKREEFACKHCGACEMDHEFMMMLDAARDEAGVPFSINSGYRCDTYDAELGGKGNHNQGKAADIAVISSRNRFKILAALLDTGFDRIGLGKTFIHVDNLDEAADKPTEVVWLY